MFLNETEHNFELPYIIFYRYFVSWMVPLILVFGCSGTFLSIVILTKKVTRRASIWSWFLALSSNDLLSLVLGLTSMYLNKLYLILDLNGGFSIDFRSYNIFVCHSLSTTLYFSLLLSSWLQVGISVLRAASITHPFWIKTKLTPRVAKKSLLVIIGATFLFSLVFINSTLGFQEAFQGNTTLGFRCKLDQRFNDFFYSVSLVLKVVLPTLVLIMSSLIIWRNLRTKIPPKRGGTTSCHYSRGFKSSSNYGNHHQRFLFNRNLSTTLLGMNLTFLVANLPFEILKVINRNYDVSRLITRPQVDHFVTVRILDKLLNIVVYLNQASNWLFYFLLGRTFRTHFCDILCCGTSKPGLKRMGFVKVNKGAQMPLI